jgi:hypothetical protein
MFVKFHAHVSFLNLTTVKILGEEHDLWCSYYNLFSSVLCYFTPLRSKDLHHYQGRQRSGR